MNNEKITEWFNNYVKIEGIENYHYHHDIGKPYCIQFDANGKAHYPNHSEVSYQKYIEIFGHDDFAEMIKHDMGFHVLRNDCLIEHCKLPFADHLYATAWAELYANAELFGGFDSDSFKIKRKRLLTNLKYLENKNEN